MYIVLFLLLCIIFGICIISFNRELLCPPCIVTLMFIFCAAFGFLTYRRASYDTFGALSALYIVLGILSFVIFSTIPYFHFRKRMPRSRTMPVERGRIEIPGGRLCLQAVVLFEVVTTIMLYMHLRSTVLGLGYSASSLTAIIANYRIISQFLEMARIPTILSIFTRISELTSIIAIFVFCHNACFKVYKRRDLLLLVIVSLEAAQLLLKSSRGELLTRMAAFVVLIYFFLKMRDGFSVRVDKKLFKAGTLTLTVFLLAFLMLAVGLGRYESLGDMDIVAYLSGYISYGIRNFDLYIKNPVEEKMFGQELFYALRASINQWTGGEILVRHLEFRSIDGMNTGNVYTAFRRFYSLWGLGGIVFFSGLQGFVYTWMYMKCMMKARGGRISFLMLLFAYISKTLFYMPIDDVFYSSLLSVGIVPRLLLLYGLYAFMVSRRIRISWRQPRVMEGDGFS